MELGRCRIARAGADASELERSRRSSPGHGLAFAGPGALDSADADTLLAWLSGRGERQLRPGCGHCARVAMSPSPAIVWRSMGSTPRCIRTTSRDASPIRGQACGDRAAIVERDLHATKLDVDALAAFAKTAADENGFAPPRQGSLALDIGKATLAGIDARASKAQVKFDSGALQIEHLSVGELGGAALDISGRIDELSSQPRGRVTVDLNAGTLADLSRVLGRFAPQDGGCPAPCRRSPGPGKIARHS